MFDFQQSKCQIFKQVMNCQHFKEMFQPLLFQSFQYTKSSLISVNGFDYYIPQKTVYMHQAFNYMSKYAVSFCTKSQGLVKELYKCFFDLMYNLLWFSFLTSYSCCINKNSIAQLLLGKVLVLFHTHPNPSPTLGLYCEKIGHVYFTTRLTVIYIIIK